MSIEGFSAKLLSAFLDGECNADETAVVLAAVRDDEHLQAELIAIEAVRSELRALPKPELSSVGLAAVIASVAAASLEPPTRAKPARRTGRSSRWIASAAAAVAVAAAVVAVTVVPTRSSIAPPVASLVDAHAGPSVSSGEPISHLGPIAVPAGFRR